MPSEFTRMKISREMQVGRSGISLFMNPQQGSFLRVLFSRNVCHYRDIILGSLIVMYFGGDGFDTGGINILRYQKFEHTTLSGDEPTKFSP